MRELGFETGVMSISFYFTTFDQIKKGNNYGKPISNLIT